MCMGSLLEPRCLMSVFGGWDRIGQGAGGGGTKGDQEGPEEGRGGEAQEGAGGRGCQGGAGLDSQIGCG